MVWINRDSIYADATVIYIWMHELYCYRNRGHKCNGEGLSKVKASK